MNRARLLADWLGKAHHAIWCNANGEPWPAWSTGEILAVALLLNDDEELTAMAYTRDEALDRLRWDLGDPSSGRVLPQPISRAEAAAALADLRQQLETGR